MHDIKDLTLEQHKNAERQEFVKTLMSGNIDHELYATYLYNQYHCYMSLEQAGQDLSLFVDTPGLQRAEHIRKDFNKLWNQEGTPNLSLSTIEYMRHIESIKEDTEKLYAHIYVRHLGDLSGGQMIRRKTPGPNNYYFFTPEQMKYKEIVRTKINQYLNIYQVNVVNEARLCFEYATRLFGEMNDLGKTD